MQHISLICNTYVEMSKDINRLKIILAEKKKTNKGLLNNWVSSCGFEMVYKFSSTWIRYTYKDYKSTSGRCKRVITLYS